MKGRQIGLIKITIMTAVFFTSVFSCSAINSVRIEAASTGGGSVAENTINSSSASGGSATVTNKSGAVTTKPKSSTTGNTWVDGIELHYLDVGQGDSTLVRCGYEAMLIDGGDESQGQGITDYLREHGVVNLKYIVCTDSDQYHCGGVDTVMYNLGGCGLVIMDEGETDGYSYRGVNDAAMYLNTKVQRPKYGRQYYLGNAMFTLVGMPRYKDNLNDDSIALILDYLNTSFIFTGDAEKAEEQAIIDRGTILKCDVLKVGHNGDGNATSPNFLSAVNPTCAVISAGIANQWGYPQADALSRLRRKGVDTYRTDEEGTIICYSDGDTIEWNTYPSGSWLSGEEILKGRRQASIYTLLPWWSSSANQEYPIVYTLSNIILSSKHANPNNFTYILDTSTQVFHMPSCPLAGQIYSNERWNFKGTREELYEYKFKACGVCRPDSRR